MKKHAIASVALILGTVLGLTLYFDVGARVGVRKAWATVYQSISDQDQVFPFPSNGVPGTGTKGFGPWYIPSATPEAFWGMTGVTFSAAAKLSGYGLPGLGGVSPSHAATVTAMTGIMTTASAGTGSITITVTDGTNTCTFTGTCAGAPPTTGFAGTTTFRIAGVNGSGTGCVFPGGNVAGTTGALSASVTASNCGTTTPIGGVTFEGNWQ